jgi:hypothetical protein
MSNLLRKLKRQHDRDSNELSPAQQKLPRGRVVGDPLKGTFLSIPIFGWIAFREGDRIPLIKLALGLLENDEEHLNKGLLELEIPLYPDTEAAALTVLDRYGWTGAIWAIGDPPPFGDQDAADSFIGLLSAVGLAATLLFGPDRETSKNPALSIEVLRAKGPFLMPPLDQPAEPPPPERLSILRDLASNYQRFYPSSGAADA